MHSIQIVFTKREKHSEREMESSNGAIKYRSKHSDRYRGRDTRVLVASRVSAG